MNKYQIGTLVNLLFDIQCADTVIPKGTTVRIISILANYYIVTMYDNGSVTFAVQESDIRLSWLGC